MRPKLIVAIIAGAILGFALLMPSQSDAAPEAETCTVTYRLDAPFRAPGYDHIVHLESTCPVAVACTVVTGDRATQVDVPAESTLGVITTSNAAAPDFDAEARCDAS